MMRQAQQEHIQGGAIGGQGGHSAKRPDWACLPNQFLVLCDKKEKIATFARAFCTLASAIMATRCRRSRQAAPRGQPRCSPNA
jgi:hypothetical protein